jgi:hypothetical protein
MSANMASGYILTGFFADLSVCYTSLNPATHSHTLQSLEIASILKLETKENITACLSNHMESHHIFRAYLTHLSKRLEAYAK